MLLSTIRSLPALLARRPRVLDDAQIALIGEYLAREMPPTVASNPFPGSPRGGIGVPIRPRPAPPTGRRPADGGRDWADAGLDGFPAPIPSPASAPLLQRTGPGARPRRHRQDRGPAAPRRQPRRLSPDTADKVDFLPIHALARDLLARNGQHLPVRQHQVNHAFTRAWEQAGDNTVLAELAPARYWRDEIDHVIKGRGLRELADYEALDRRGRTLPLTDTHKHTVWTLLHAYQDHLDRAGTSDNNDVLSAALRAVTCHPPDPNWSAVLVDEVQDLTVLGIRLCRELAGDGVDALFLVGDGQQALYPGGFTLAEARVSVTGRAVVLRTNYRNTRQIIDSARQLVADRDFTDLDTTTEPGHQEIEILRDGPPVRHQHAPHRHGLALLLRQVMRSDAATGIRWGDMAVLCHTHAHLDDITRRLTALGIPLRPLSDWDGEPDDQVKIGTIHRSKGLDFAAVYLPDLTPPRNPPTSATTTESNDWDVLHAQREYVARTRPRDRLWIGRIRSRHAHTPPTEHPRT